jgi:diaminopimelate epimerase
MNFDFWKYQGAGNDFILLDQRRVQYLTRADTARIERLCDRRFGIGADGLILLQQAAGYDFEMVYFNADGRESTLCGNGGRCIAAFAQKLGVVGTNCRFIAIDGPHEARIFPHPKHSGDPSVRWVELKMGDVRIVNPMEDGQAFVLNTGSPHYVHFVSDLAQFPVVEEGRHIRYGTTFGPSGGINVNFVEKNGHGLHIRTYERGVEDETLACGTGVTAAALAAHLKNGDQPGDQYTPVQAQGDALSVRFHADGQGHFSDIWLCGPATFVFGGNIN